MDQDGTWYGGGTRSRPHCTRWGPRYPRRKGGNPPIFGPFLLWPNGGWIKMQLGTEGNLGPGDVVLDGVASPRKRGTAPVFGPCLLWPNGWIDEDATWYGSRSRPKPHCVRGEPSFPANGAQQPPLFSAHVYCGHGRPSQLLLSFCYKNNSAFLLCEIASI